MFDLLISETPNLIEQNIIDFYRTKEIPNKLKEALLYAIESGGKKLRPFLFFATLSLLKVDYKKYVDIASAIEMIHTYSLIHDDLPAMDNDDLRRGKPTLHKKYDEATAILAGDSMLTHSFELIANTNAPLTDTQKIKLVEIIAKASGACGMIAGQQLDMDSENKEISLKQLEEIHLKKTGELIKVSVISACVVANTNLNIESSLGKYALLIGKAFQIKDDILDVESTTEVLGKPVGSDEQNSKSTYPKLTSLEESKNILKNVILDAKAVLKEIDLQNSVLNDVCDYIVNRKK